MQISSVNVIPPNVPSARKRRLGFGQLTNKVAVESGNQKYNADTFVNSGFKKIDNSSS